MSLNIIIDVVSGQLFSLCNVLQAHDITVMIIYLRLVSCSHYRMDFKYTLNFKLKLSVVHVELQVEAECCLIDDIHCALCHRPSERTSRQSSM